VVGYKAASCQVIGYCNDGGLCITSGNAVNFFSSLFGVKSKPSKRPGGKNMTTSTARKAAEPAAIRVTKDIDRALTSAAKDFKTTRAKIVKNALLEYLEDLADSKAIADAKKQGGPMIPFSELRKRVGV
jgi:predicted DNA-binding protein